LSTAFGGGGDGGVETERHVGGAQVVVDGLGPGNDLHAFMEQFEGDLLRAVAATVRMASIPSFFALASTVFLAILESVLY
jgi:hypothetical protein